MFQVIKRLKKHGRYIDQDYDNNEVIKKTAAPVTFVSIWIISKILFSCFEEHL